jgi:hypothetical protein
MMINPAEKRITARQTTQTPRQTGVSETGSGRGTPNPDLHGSEFEIRAAIRQQARSIRTPYFN